MKFRRFCRKLGSLSKNIMSDFAPEIAKYPQSSPKPQNSVRAYLLAPLSMQLVDLCISLVHSIFEHVFECCALLKVQYDLVCVESTIKQ